MYFYVYKARWTECLAITPLPGCKGVSSWGIHAHRRTWRLSKTYEGIVGLREMISWAPSSTGILSENRFCYISFSILPIIVRLLLDQGKHHSYPSHSESYCGVLSWGAKVSSHQQSTMKILVFGLVKRMDIMTRPHIFL